MIVDIIVHVKSIFNGENIPRNSYNRVLKMLTIRSKCTIETAIFSDRNPFEI